MKRSEVPLPDHLQLIQLGYRYAMSLCHHKQDAEDLIQTACLKVLRQRGKLTEKNYLFATIRNLFYDNLRRQQRSPNASVVDDSLPDKTQNHETKVNRQMDLSELLKRLSVTQREVLFLHSVEGYTADEISRLTGQPRGTVLSHLSRAKKKLASLSNHDPILEAK